MLNNPEKITLYWTIFTFDKNNNFPPERKKYCLDWEQLNEEQTNDIISILGKDLHGNIKIESKHIPVYDNINLFSSSPDDQEKKKKLIKYRKYFMPFVSTKMHLTFESICIIDYFENSDGDRVVIRYDNDDKKEIALYNKKRHSGEWVLGSLESILREGNSKILNKNNWCQKHSDTIGHFLQISELIHCSKWMKYNPRSTVKNGKTYHEIPDIESVVFILIYLRQLLEEELLENVIKYYIEFIDNDRKKMWIEFELDEWNSHLDDFPLQNNIKNLNINNRQLIDAFFYGSLICHRKPFHSKAQNFELLYNLEKREESIWALWWCLTLLIKRISNVAGLISYDFNHWLDTEEIPKPNILWQKNMFK